LVPSTPFDSFFNILILVTIISLVAWRLKFPPTIAFIIGGVASTLSTGQELPILSPEIFVTILLPPILFQEALHLDVDGFIEEADSIFTFAVCG
jgi:NhaP-type Na+/H+ or K+/H+ antiporter